MRVLIFGVTGMLGHKLYEVLQSSCEVYGTTRSGSVNDSNIVPLIDARNKTKIQQTIDQVKPDVVVNCIGLVKQNPEAKDKQASVIINALLPHKLHELCEQRGARLIQISTDCVFNGANGNYTESDWANPVDLYGHSKCVGEVIADNALTIRTSMIGRELRGHYGLLEWLIKNQGGNVSGYTKSIFSGFPTLHLSFILQKIIMELKDLSGLYHIASKPIDKYSLLKMINQEMGLGIKIDKVPGVECNRSLSGAKFNKATGFKPKPWLTMIKEMAQDACYGY
jgi:dTDP-4-dehydrorhamnose reductase